MDLDICSFSFERGKTMRPEILAPVGSMDALHAALAAGCDAVYFGLPDFGARAFANNFDLETTKKVIDRCHLCGVKVYITMNTILYEGEVEQAYQMAKTVHSYGVDALIIQDLGFIHLLHHRLPNLVLHASTQLSISNPFQIEQLKKLGVKRVVLARECTKEEIQACVNTGIEVEVFVHGALCICYSGQCYFSSVHYGRSGNRGMCAQPCRMKYSLFEDDKKVIDTQDYLLSPKDLSLIDEVNELSKIGVCSLKIEGRMKSAPYVFESVSQVKKVLNHQKRDGLDQQNLLVTFNREYTKGHMYKACGSELMNSKTSNHQGIEIGKVLRVKKNNIFIQLSKDLHQNDGIRFERENTGCNVNFMYDRKHRLISCMTKNNVVEIEGPSGIHVGSIVRKTIDYELNKTIENQIQSSHRQSRVNAIVTCLKVGQPMSMEVFNDVCRVKVFTSIHSAQALNRATDSETLNKQFSKTKDSWAYFDHIEYHLGKDIYFPISAMNQLRRDALEKMKIAFLKRDAVVEKAYTYCPKETQTNFDLIEIQSLNQKVDVRQGYVSEMFKNELVLEKSNITGTKGEVNAHLGKGKIVDSLNISNSYGIAALLEMGYESAVLSDECDENQVEDLMLAFRSRYHFDAPVYKTLYQKRRLMTMKHCPVNTTLKDGKRLNCSLCRTHRYELEGLDGKRVFLIGDRDCHMRLFDVETTNEIENRKDYERLGIKHFRFVFTDENKEDVERVFKAYNR